MTALIALASGLLFAIGLGVGGMTQPSKVIAFLDVLGAWDPSLMFVMGGAIPVFGLAHYLSRRLRGPLSGASFADLTPRPLDARLLTGAAIFGVGWGLAGFCPGPALTSLGAPVAEAALVVVGIVLGTATHKILITRPTVDAKESTP